MKDRVSMGSATEKLLNFVNTAQVHDSYYEIASILVKNSEKAKRMSIAEMADFCYASQATISRFCRFLGYESFRHFHEELNYEFRLMDEYTDQFRSLLKTSDTEAAKLYLETVNTNLKASLSEENLKRIARAADLIDESPRTAFFSHHFLWDAGHFFQARMILMDKYIELYQSYENQMHCAETLDESCTAIICSAGGSFFSYYPDLVKTIMDSGAKVIVMTQNTDSEFVSRADHVISIGETNQDDTGKYGALAVIDQIVLQYMRRHYARRAGEGEL